MLDGEPMPMDKFLDCFLNMECIPAGQSESEVEIAWEQYKKDNKF